MAGRNNYIRGNGGRFAGSTGGHVGGGQSLGGNRGVIARSRLRQALTKLRAARHDAAITGGKRDQRIARNAIARRLRAVLVHRREVARIEKRGASKLKELRGSGIKLSKGEIQGKRQDRVFFAREKLGKLLAQRRADTFASAKLAREALRTKNLRLAVHVGTRAKYARAILRARRQLRNRQRELARSEK